MMPDGNLDVDAIHGACPVRKGTKWGANWWYAAARPAHRCAPWLDSAAPPGRFWDPARFL
jgi:hypothetical protein